MNRLARVFDHVAYRLARIGWPGLLGLALLAFAVLTQRHAVEPLRDAAAELDARAEALAARPAPPPAPAPPPSPLESLPRDAEVPAGVARLFSAAEHAGLALARGSYRAQVDGDGTRRFHIMLPLEGDYPAIRAFLAEAAERQPGLVLDRLNIARDSIDRKSVV